MKLSFNKLFASAVAATALSTVEGVKQFGPVLGMTSTFAVVTAVAAAGGTDLSPHSNFRGGGVSNKGTGKKVQRSLDADGNADVLTGQVCMQQAAGFNLQCTANDIQLASATNIFIEDDGCAFAGDTVTFTADFEVVLTAQARHDVGIWFSEDGDPNGDASLTGTCTAVTPAYGPDPPFLDLDGTNDPFPGENKASGIQDTCGDIDNDHNPLFQEITLTVKCIDLDGDGKLNLPYCTSWRQPGDNDLCRGPLEAVPGAPSKCKCDNAFNIDIEVPSCVPEDCADQCNDGVCQPDGTCVQVPKVASTPCEDGSYCTSFGGVPGDADHCDGAGTCVGDPVNCGPGDQCFDDVCDDDANACVVVNKDASTSCEDGLYCTSFGGVPGDSDHCDGSGTCVGDPVNCGPGDQCFNDVCDDDADACVVVNKDASTSCEDGLYCTSFGGVPGDSDHCDGSGTCVGDPVNCGPGDQCFDDVCDDDADACVVVNKDASTSCEDGLYCTSFGGVPGDSDHCDGSGTCVGDPVNCGPGDQCFDDVCDDDANACVVVNKDASTSCEDGLYCTSFGGVPGDSDHCDGSGTCVGDPVNCGPGDQCFDDVCDDDADACVVVNKDASTSCEDGLYCTSFGGVPGDADHCDGAGECVGDPVNCGPGDQCFDDVCDDDADACVVVNKDASTSCEDGLYCTSFGGVPGDSDHCDGAGECVGDPVNCGPGDQCFDDVCDDDADACVVVNKDASTSCEDGLYCTSFGGVPGDSDHCDGAGECVGDPVNCGPGDQCFDDVCDDDADACVVVNKDASTSCEDGLYCTSFGGVPGDSDHCDGSGTCVGDPVNCGPGDQCFDDVCDDDADACVVVNKDASTSCEDGLYCTSFGGVPGDSDHCDGSGTCVGDPVNCGPGDQCFDDVCDDDTNACVVVNKDASTSCEDGLYCTSFGGVPGEADHCDGAGECVGDPVNCGPGDQCFDDVCDDDADACVVVNKVASTSCEDGLYCTSFGGVPGDADHCDGAGECVGDPVVCNDDNVCTSDSCNDDTDQCDFDPEPAGTSCGVATDEVCDAADTCDGTGVCVDNKREDGYYLKCGTDLYLCQILQSEIEKVKNSYHIGGCNTGRVRNIFELDPATCLDEPIPDICANGQDLSNYGFATCTAPDGWQGCTAMFP